MLKLYAKTFGDPKAEALILLHGLFGSSTNWGSIARQLADDYYVIVPDLRNHGQSPHAVPHSYAAMSDDLIGLLDSHGLSAATFIGHSMGGKVAMHLALTRPERVSRLAVLDISPVVYSHGFDAVLDGFDAVQLATIGSRADADAQMRAAVPASGVRAFLLQNLTREDGRWMWRLNLPALGEAQAEITGFPRYAEHVRFEGPVRFIHGELSDYVKPSHHVVIDRLFPRASMCRVEGAGHWVYADQPQGFMDCLNPFVGR